MKLLACFQICDYKAAFTLMYLVFLEVDAHHFHFYFKFLVENNNVIISRTFCLQLLNKDYG